MTKADKILIVFLLVFSAAALVFLNFSVYSDTPSSVVISVDGKEYARYPLGELEEPRTVEVRTEYGYNIIELSREGARVLDASCRDKLDVHSGMISKSNQMIICVPNRLDIRIDGGSEEVDGVAY